MDSKEFHSSEFLRYQRLLKARSYGFWEWMPKDDSLQLRGGFWGVLGYELGDGAQVPQVEQLVQVIHPDDWPSLLKTAARVLDVGEVLEVRVRVRQAHEGYRWVCLEGEVTRRSDQQVYCVSGIAFDITVQRELELKLQDSEERHARILDSSSDGIWEWTQGEESIHFSDRCWQQLGYDDHDDAMLMGRNRLQVWRESIHADDRPVFDEALVAHLKRNAPFDVEYRVAAKSGEWRWIRARGQSRRDADGTAVCMSGTNMDITELKSAEERTMAAREAAEAANQAKSRFLSSMSHELRTPLNAILGYCQVFAMDGSLTENQQQSAREIRKAGNHLLQLVNEVMDLSRIEAGQMSLSLETVPVMRLLEECLAWIKPLADVRRIRLERDYGRLKDACVVADVTRLKQVLLNLISNAVKYNREQGFVIARLRKQDSCLRIEIEDSGLGIASDRHHELFEPFNRLGAERSAVEGTGVGLSITRSLVEGMGGELSFASQEGSGSCFAVTLPEAQVVSAPQPAVATLPAKTRQPPDGPIRLLYIEDNASNVRVMQELLSPWSQIKLEVADEPFYGLYLARMSKPDMVLMDINLPRMDGFETLLFMQQDPSLQSIPVVALSANALPADIERGRVAGFMEYLTKPVQLPELLQVLHQLDAFRAPDTD